MRRFFGSIRFRMVAIYLVVIVLAFVAISTLVSAMVEQFLVEQRTTEQINDTLRLAETVRGVLSGPDVPVNLLAAATDWVRGTDRDGHVLFLDTDAVVQMDTASLYNGYRLPYREVREVLLTDASAAYGFHRVQSSGSISGAGGGALGILPGARWVVYYAVPVRDQSSGLLGVLLYAVSIQEIADSVNEMTGRIGLVFGVFAATVGVVSLFLSGWLTRPILTLTNAIRRVGAQGYSERVPVRGKDELSELAEAFNLMSEKLENHDRVRNEFVSNASHELKTPLSSMKILAESMLYQDELDPQMTREFFQDIDHEVDRLTRIINDLLRLVQEENAAQELQIEQVDYTALIERVIARLMPIAKRKGIRLEKKLAQVSVEADPLRIEQVVTNLIDNALKYTDKGSVAITLKQEGPDAVLTVRDTGIGIPKESISRLFERFYRVDKARSRDTGGTGLGLSIVEKIVSAHHGYIHVDSVEGRGTSFIVHLPLRQPQREGGAV